MPGFGAESEIWKLSSSVQSRARPGWPGRARAQKTGAPCTLPGGGEKEKGGFVRRAQAGIAPETENGAHSVAMRFLGIRLLCKHGRLCYNEKNRAARRNHTAVRPQKRRGAAMFCTHCGAYLEGHERFCPGCGACLAPSGAAGPGWQQPSPAAPSGAAQGWQQPAPAVPSGAAQGWQQPVYGGYAPSWPPRPVKAPRPDAYYVREFEKLAATGKGSFNWAAFFLGPYHCLYRGCVPRFLKLYLPLWAVSLAVGIFTQVQSLAAWRGNGKWYAASLLLGLLCSLWAIGVGLYNGFTFNRHYYTRVQGNAAARTRPGLMGIALAVQAMVSIMMAVLMLAGLGAELGRGIRSEMGSLLDGAPYEDVQDGSHSDPQGKYDALFSAILDSHAGAAGAVQDYTQGYTVPRAWPTGVPNEMMLRASRLFADDALSVGTLVSAMDNMEWSEEYAADEASDGWNSQILYGEVGQTAVQLEFARKGELVSIVSAITYLTDDTDPDSYYELTQEELAAFVQWLYEQAGAQGGGIAVRVRGTWVDSAGQELQISPDALGGEACELWFVEDGALVLRLDGGTYRRLVLSQGDSVLTISECDENGVETAQGATYYR